MLKWSKDKTKEEVLADLKLIFDKHKVTSVETTDKKFWENGDIELFFVAFTDNMAVNDLENDLSEYYFDLDTFPSGNCGAIVLGMDTENHIEMQSFYKSKKFMIYENGKWVI